MKTIIRTIAKTMNCGRNRRCTLDVNGICFSLRLKGRDVWGRCHSLPPVEPRDRNHMMDNNKVMRVCFDAFCFPLVGHLRTSKYVSPLCL